MKCNKRIEFTTNASQNTEYAKKTFYANYLQVLTAMGLFLKMSVSNFTSLIRM